MVNNRWKPARDCNAKKLAAYITALEGLSKKVEALREEERALDAQAEADGIDFFAVRNALEALRPVHEYAKEMAARKEEWLPYVVKAKGRS
jgi:hypothetical protein